MDDFPGSLEEQVEVLGDAIRGMLRALRWLCISIALLVFMWMMTLLLLLERTT